MGNIRWAQLWPVRKVLEGRSQRGIAQSTGRLEDVIDPRVHAACIITEVQELNRNGAEGMTEASRGVRKIVEGRVVGIATVRGIVVGIAIAAGVTVLHRRIAGARQGTQVEPPPDRVLDPQGIAHRRNLRDPRRRAGRLRRRSLVLHQMARKTARYVNTLLKESARKETVVKTGTQAHVIVG